MCQCKVYSVNHEKSVDIKPKKNNSEFQLDRMCSMAWYKRKPYFEFVNLNEQDAKKYKSAESTEYQSYVVSTLCLVRGMSRIQISAQTPATLIQVDLRISQISFFTFILILDAIRPVYLT